MQNMATLKTGALAYFDCFSGLVPVSVLSVTAPKERPVFDLGRGQARISVKVTCKVTAERGPYKKGAIIDSNSFDVMPRGAIRKHMFSSTVDTYAVQPD